MALAVTDTLSLQSPHFIRPTRALSSRNQQRVLDTALREKDPALSRRGEFAEAVALNPQITADNPTPAFHRDRDFPLVWIVSGLATILALVLVTPNATASEKLLAKPSTEGD